MGRHDSRAYVQNGWSGQLARSGRQPADQPSEGTEAARQVVGQHRLVAGATQMILKTPLMLQSSWAKVSSGKNSCKASFTSDDKAAELFFASASLASFQ